MGDQRPRDERLREAAQHGRIDVFYTLIREDANLLDRIDQVPFIDTPLHIAASVGQTGFAMEMVNLKPSFSRKLNQDGFSPMHLALQNGHHQMVLRLLAVDRDLVRVKGREGVTPLHFAAKEGLEKTLAEFLLACPKSIQDLTIRNETALHIAAKNDRVEALEVLLGWLRVVDHRGVVNWEEDDGNTILDIAINKIQGLTALENLEDQRVQWGNKKIGKLLRLAGAARASSLTPVNTLEEFLKKFSFGYRLFFPPKEFTNEDRNAMMVCAVLIATSTFQSVVNPLVGVLQNNNSPATGTAATTTQGNGSLPHYGVGTFVDKWFYFWVINSIAFLFSVLYIYINLGFLRWHITLCNLLPLTTCYVLALLIVTPNLLFIFYFFILVFVTFLVMKVVFYFYRKNEDNRHIRSLLKRWPSFHREMAELENSN